ncbi:hypothetical protein I4U23_011009 [Adineta vaga]|nr:hypothetical protein I4U23_011009 [Adineta vaga]
MSPVWIITLYFILTLKEMESNQFRQNCKLPLMCLSKKLNAAALQHSRWMSKNSKLIHGTGKRFKTAENIALNSGRSVHYTVNQRMKSPKHRASILNPN